MAFVKHDWWLVDREGRRIGWLWPEDFEAICESFFGRVWIDSFCELFGYNRSQIDRYRRGFAPIPKHVAQIVQMLQTMKNHNLPLSPLEAPWLPEVEGANARGDSTSGEYVEVKGNANWSPRDIIPAKPKELSEKKRRGRPRKSAGGRPKGSNA